MLTALSVFASDARAFVDLDGRYWLAGGSFGYVTDGDRRGALLGVEASLVETDDDLAEWAGVYVDVLYDTLGVVRSSVGLEGGSLFTGVDVGPVVELGDEIDAGVRLRLVVTIALVSVYVGGTQLLWGSERRMFETGVLLKFGHEL